MILTKKMAEKAKALIGEDRNIDLNNVHGVCWALTEVSDCQINVYRNDNEFWGVRCIPTGGGERWPLTPEGDIKRRAFIDSLIGKDL